MSTPAYLDADLSVGDRVDDLISRMDIEEKLPQLGAVEFPRLMTGDRFDPDKALAVIPHGIGQVTRIGATTGLEPAESADLFNQIQRMAVEQTRLGIPVMVHEESLAGYCARGATVFPQALALGCSWDSHLVAEVADHIRLQLLAVGARHSLAPVLDVARDPRWGRLEETYGEDPVLAGTLGAAYVRAMQTEDLSQGVLATGKHFLAHGMSEGGRNHAPVQMGPRELREIYAEPFAAAIREAGLATVMSSYSCVDGLPGSGSAEILTRLLRDELGFKGMVVADYFAVTLLMSYHRVAADRAEAAIKALTAGLDLELPALDCFSQPLKQAVSDGRLPMSFIDRALGRVLTAKMELGLFESPYVEPSRATVAFDDPGNISVARRAAIEGVVMLTNNDLLPLAEDISRLAVVGPAADDRRLLQGDYHYPAHQELMFEQEAARTQNGPAKLEETTQPAQAARPGQSPHRPVDAEDPMDTVFLPTAEGRLRPGEYYTDHVTPLAALRSALAPGVDVTYEKGCDLVGNDRSGLPAAVAAAASADVAVVMVGGRSGLGTNATVGEARDAVDLRLTGVQEELVRSVAATGTPTVLFVMSGRAHVLTDLAGAVGALLVAWPLGEQGGNAIADVLTGRAEPGGRLAVSLPRATGQVPRYTSHRSGGSVSVFHNDYTDCSHEPLFSFGHGLGYTTFGYSDMSVEGGSTSSPSQVSVTVTNTGARSGEEVVQLYASDLVASVARPEQSLIAFTRLALAPGLSARVTFEVHPSRLAFYDEQMRFVVEPGEFRFAVGASSADVREKVVVALDGPVAPYEQRSIVAAAVTISNLEDRSAAKV